VSEPEERRTAIVPKAHTRGHKYLEWCAGERVTQDIDIGRVADGLLRVVPHQKMGIAASHADPRLVASNVGAAVEVLGQQGVEASQEGTHFVERIFKTWVGLDGGVVSGVVDEMEVSDDLSVGLAGHEARNEQLGYT
jgi:hypothetical protein